MKLDFPIIAVDFDGTLCENKWPDIGAPNMRVINYVKNERKNGVKIILWTCREGELLDNALAWCAEQGLEFDEVNKNVPEAVELFGGDSRKIYADEYLDDKAAWIDLIFGQSEPYKKIMLVEDGSVDYDQLSMQLEEHNPDILPVLYRAGSIPPSLVNI